MLKMPSISILETDRLHPYLAHLSNLSDLSTAIIWLTEMIQSHIWISFSSRLHWRYIRRDISNRFSWKTFFPLFVKSKSVTLRDLAKVSVFLLVLAMLPDLVKNTCFPRVDFHACDRSDRCDICSISPIASICWIGSRSPIGSIAPIGSISPTSQMNRWSNMSDAFDDPKDPMAPMGLRCASLVWGPTGPIGSIGRREAICPMGHMRAKGHMGPIGLMGPMNRWFDRFDSFDGW